MDYEAIFQILHDHRETIRQQFAVQQLLVFGSIARREAGDASDIDVLVEFEGPATFNQYMDLKFYLEDLLTMKVDLVTRQSIRPELKQQIECEAQRVA